MKTIIISALTVAVLLSATYAMADYCSYEYVYVCNPYGFCQYVLEF